MTFSGDHKVRPINAMHDFNVLLWSKSKLRSSSVTLSDLWYDDRHLQSYFITEQQTRAKEIICKETDPDRFDGTSQETCPSQKNKLERFKALAPMIRSDWRRHAQRDEPLLPASLRDRPDGRQSLSVGERTPRRGRQAEIPSAERDRRKLHEGKALVQNGTF